MRATYKELAKRQRLAERNALEEQRKEVLKDYREKQGKLAPSSQSARIDFVSHTLVKLAEEIKKAQDEFIDGPDVYDGTESDAPDSGHELITSQKKTRPGRISDALPLLTLEPETLALIALRTIFNLIGDSDDDKENVEVPSRTAVAAAIGRSCYEQWKQWVLASPSASNEARQSRRAAKCKTAELTYQDAEQGTKREMQQEGESDAASSQQEEKVESDGARNLDQLAEILLARQHNRNGPRRVRQLLDKFKDRPWAKDGSGAVLGDKILDMAQKIGLIEIILEPHPQYKGWGIERVWLNPDLVARAERIKDSARVLFRPQYGPMICPPDKRTGLRGGGFLTASDPARAENLALRDLVKHRNHQKHLQKLEKASLEKVCVAVNALQETPWRLNRPIYALLLYASKNEEIALPGLPNKDDLPALKEKFNDWVKICQEHRRGRQQRLGQFAPDKSIEQQAEYQRDEEEFRRKFDEYADTLHRYHALDSRIIRFNRLLTTCNDLLKRYAELGEDLRLYFPFQLDYRGRMYSMVTALSPQGSDIERALLEFADGKPLGEEGEYWLAVHLANTAGQDKRSFEGRVEWVRQHDAEIRVLAAVISSEEGLADRLANLPIAARSLWEDAKKPWSFLAACLEWANHEEPGFVSHLPVALDASASGFQHLSALLLDAKLARVTNLLPASATDPPQDLYGIVAEELKKRVEERATHKIRNSTSKNAKKTLLAQAWIGQINRNTVKPGVMTMPYGAGESTREKQILQYVREKTTPGLFGEPEAAARFLTSQLEQVLHEGISKSAFDVMEWLRTVAKTLAKNYVVGVSWTTPVVGFPVVTELYRPERSQVSYRSAGKRHSFSYLDQKQEDPTISETKQELAIAPNFIHSLDAAHLTLTIYLLAQKGLHHFSAIHDSIALHACDIAELRQTLKQTFVDIYSKPPLDDFLEQQCQVVRDILAEEIKDLQDSSHLSLAERDEKIRELNREIKELPALKALKDALEEVRSSLPEKFAINLVLKSEYMFS